MSQFDYIVVGAGSAGCVVAARLAEDPNAKVLLIEAGGSDDTVYVREPGMIAIVHQVPQLKKRFDWGFKTAPQKHLNGRQIPYTRGRVLGGCSSINGMLYLRGNRANYDDWAKAGCAGWSYEDVLPYYRRSEDHQDGASKYHGAGGPLKITKHESIRTVSQAFLEAVEDVCEVPILDDFNGASQEGASVYQMTALRGLRSSTSYAFVNPAREKPNFHVETQALVRRVLVEKGRAIGVEIVQGKQTKTFLATTEVVLCGGAIGSPQILMLSGIGPAAHLREHGVDVVHDLPGVGQNLHDHLFCPMTFVAPEAINRGTAWYFFMGMLKERMGGQTWFGRTVFEAGAFLRAWPDSKIPDLQFHTLPWAYPDPNQDGPDRPKVDKRPCLTVMPTLIYPKSRGELRLLSNDPAAAPHIDPHFFEDPADVRQLARGIRMTREILASPKIKEMIGEELAPGANRTTDDEIAAEMRLRSMTVYHPVGTCKMGIDPMAVVDPQLRVHGIEGLRVADASIMPSITGGNTNGPCIMIGEKAADLIRGVQASTVAAA